eukprot:COSAG06_NODE_1618_length_8914_cov_10.299830_4_plen_106_part_00
MVTGVHRLVEQVHPKGLAHVPFRDRLDRTRREEVCVVEILGDQIHRRPVVVPHVGNPAVAAAGFEAVDVGLPAAEEAEVPGEATVDRQVVCHHPTTSRYIITSLC